MAKTDIENAFRLLPIFPSDRNLLGFTWKSEDGLLQYYVDACLPMGLTVSCRYFEAFSTALQWIMENKYGDVMSHIIDDFFFVGPPDSLLCYANLSVFKYKNYKTVWHTTKISIYGTEVDSQQLRCVSILKL